MFYVNSYLYVFFFFKQKTAYEMRISDWSSDVCSSDLNADPVRDLEINGGGTARLLKLAVQSGVRKVIYASSGGTVYGEPRALPVAEDHPKIGRASCRERVCQYV